jgi:DNA-binding IclR family transcriptional regulator
MSALAASGKTGMRLTDVVQATGMQKTVVHRALAGLTLYGLASHDPANGRFYLGDTVFAWTRRADERFALAKRVVPYLRALADELLDTVSFSVIRGDIAVCYAREEGSFPIKVLSLEVGAVRPLGVGSGSLILFSFQPEEFRERVIAAHGEERLKYGVTDDMLRHNVRETLEKRYALHKGLFAENMMGLAVPVCNSRGACVAAISIAAITPRLAEPRLAGIVARARAEVAVIQEQLAELLDEI